MATHSNRAVSETLGVAVLIGITLLVTGAVGVGVFIDTVADDDSVEFTFDYAEQLDQLVIVYQDDEDFAANEVYVEGPAGNFTWAELTEMEDETGSILDDDTVFLNDAGPYGADVEEDDQFTITYAPADGESRVLAEFGEDEEGAEDPLDPDTGPDPGGPGGPDEP